MKRRILPLVLALAIVLALLPAPALGASLEDYPVIKSNFNTSAVQNNPDKIITISVNKSVWLWSITTYHWNNGKGATPGTISIEKDGTVVGTWKATGRSGSGVSNVLWDVYPDFILEPGHEYVIRDSDESTWSWNSGTGGAGMMEFRGASSRPANVSVPSTPSSSPAGTTTVKGYTCAPWAVSEISKASDYGLIPTSLSGGDLTRPISRRDFAVVSLLTYCRMGKTGAPDPGSNPFTDTNDPDVLRAYQVGIVNGTSDTTFSPNDNLTREQASTMLTRVYKKIVLPGWSLTADSSFSLNYTPTGSFSDQNSISAFARDSVSFMAAKGIVNGVGNNTFAPKNNVTRQEALAIAVRMTENLDTTPQAQQPSSSGGSEGPAQGTLTNGDFTITFDINQKGEAVLTRDGDGYDLLLTDMPDGEIQVSLPAQAPAKEGMENVIYMGIPCRDSNGKEGFEPYALDTTYANGRATATVTLSDYEDAIADLAYDTTATGKTDYSAEFAKKQAAAVGSKINVKIAVYFFCETEFLITSDAGHFRIYIPQSNYTSQSDAVSGKINKEDGKRIVEELEDILSFYQSIYKVKRSNWPMKVISHSGDDDGVYGSGQMKLKFSGLSNGYGRDITSSQKLYETMAHELFHFVQREYTPVALSQSWFDEAAASYYGIQFGYQRCGSFETAIKNENYNADAEAQYQGITPMDVSTLGWFDFLHAGYGRASFIDYLMKYHGTDFLKRYYEQGITLAGLQTEARLENLTGKSLGELAVDFYVKLVTEKDSVQGVLNIPSDIFDRSYSGGAGDEGEASLDAVRTTWKLTGEKESTVISVPRYGAYFVALDMSEMNPGAKTFTLTVPTADCESRLIAIHRADNATQYDVQKVFKPSGGKFEKLPIDGTRYLLMMINNNGSWGWTVSETLEMTYEDTLKKDGAYPSTFDELPTLFKGTARTWTGGRDYSHKDQVSNAECEISYENGRLYFTMFPDGPSNYDTMFTASRDGFLDSRGYKDCISSDGGHFYVQMETGTWVDRTKGPKPTAEQLAEWQASSSPFGHYIEGDETTNVMRVIWFDKFGNMNVFEGSGYNNNGYSYDPDVTINEEVSVDDSQLETTDVVVTP